MLSQHRRPHLVTFSNQILVQAVQILVDLLFASLDFNLVYEKLSAEIH